MYIFKGQYSKFINDSISFEIEIRKCNETTHKNIINSNTNLKSW